MLRRINNALPGLVFGIILYGALVELAGVWFVTDKLMFSTGLWIGVATAVGMAIHMAVVIEDAVDMLGEEKAKTRLAMKSVLRYVAVVIVFLLMMFFHLGSLLSAFVGVMGLKVAAYLQPLMYKAVLKLQGRGDVSSGSTE